MTYMNNHGIDPNKITKPIQLLSAWIIGLIVTDSVFLYSAINFETQSWERGALVISAILNVPFFLVSLFLLQTKFRIELQEDSFYHDYISKKNAAHQRIDKDTIQDSRLLEIEKALTISSSSTISEQHPAKGITPAWNNWSIAVNDLHPQFKEILDALASYSIPVSSIFGSVNGSKVPSQWVAAINPTLPKDHKLQLLRAILPFNFDGFEFHTPIKDANEDDDVYIGCYGPGDYCIITNEFRTMISEELTDADLHNYYQRHQLSALARK
ncbi:hypothetical protein N5C40_17070 [Pseudomonas fulva]|uniref:hypothetical protein n=1 Tax=Pseudomonas fulva TaxID=47880 RepID=UPI0024484F33|nr:hypothetical protein [Pseudomonas fulva]MDH1308235.1 hypothetical protein [Pseudomonas fulva]